jgi:agmatine/peptidylarginine deiminase
LFNDGGNFVDDYAGNVVISTKFLTVNDLSESEAREYLTEFDSISHVALFEADKQGRLEHADGVVSFIDHNTLMINQHPDDPDHAAKLKADLRRGLPDVIIHEIPRPYDDSTIYDERFGSACGLYTNALVTPERIYLPQFGIVEDQVVLVLVRSLTTKIVIPVSSEGVCFMGGRVRCMSWHVRGENAKRVLGMRAEVQKSMIGAPRQPY